jgi:ankyrin repeat protein
MPLSTAGTTALGHSLLHIASLPLTSEYIDKKNPYSVQTIHCARTLDSDWLSHAFPSPLHLDPNKRPGYGLTRPIPDQYIEPTIPLTSLEQEAQLSTLRLLVQVVGVDVRAQDIHGNTALHYLATTL